MPQMCILLGSSGVDSSQHSLFQPPTMGKQYCSGMDHEPW